MSVKQKIFAVIIFLFLVVICFNLLISFFFPLKYWDEIKYYSKVFSLDPFLVAAVINAESSFDSGALSDKGAKGLMQLMPNTAAWIAENNHIGYHEENLYDPEYNIFLGCWYLANLNQVFDDRIPVVLAAYNGGRGNTSLWLESEIWNGELSDIENIPFTETSTFVQKVIFYHQMYILIYERFEFMPKMSSDKLFLIPKA